MADIRITPSRVPGFEGDRVRVKADGRIGVLVKQRHPWLFSVAFPLAQGDVPPAVVEFGEEEIERDPSNPPPWQEDWSVERQIAELKQERFDRVLGWMRAE